LFVRRSLEGVSEVAALKRQLDLVVIDDVCSDGEAVLVVSPSL